MIIDGIPVTDEEKAKAELYFMDQQVGRALETCAAVLNSVCGCLVTPLSLCWFTKVFLSCQHAQQYVVATTSIWFIIPAKLGSVCAFSSNSQTGMMMT